MMKVGFLHAGILQAHPSGVTRYGQLIARCLASSGKAVVREASVVLTSDQIKNEQRLRGALNKLLECDVIHIQYSPNIWNRMFLKKLIPVLSSGLRPPLVLTLHDSGSLNYFFQFKRILSRLPKTGMPGMCSDLWTVFCRLIMYSYLTFKASKICIHSHYETRDLPWAFFLKHKLSVIPHFVEDRQMALSRTEAKRMLGLDQGLVITLLGFIFERKGYDLLVKAAVSFPHGTTVIFAGGPSKGNDQYLENIKKLAEKLGVDRNIRITGFLSDEEQDQYMAATDIAVAPFKSMSASGSLSTWIASGHPVILATQLPEIEEYNAAVPGSIRTFSPYTPETLAQEVQLIADQLKSVERQSPVKELKEMFSIRRVCKFYGDVYGVMARKALAYRGRFPVLKSLPVAVPVRVSVIVPVRNNRNGIERLLNSISRMNFPVQDREIIVVDNGSTDGTLEFLKARHDILLIEETRIMSSYAARNRGIEVSRGDVLAFTDSDCEVDTFWLDKAVAALENEHLDIVSGCIVRSFPKNLTASDLVDDCKYLRNDEYAKQGVSATANTVIRRACFEKVGLFPEYVSAGGDWIWTASATRSGLRLGYVSQAVVTHPTHGLEHLIRKMFRGGTCYKDVAHAIDPSGRYFWHGIIYLLCPKSWAYSRWKLFHSGERAVPHYPLKAWGILHVLNGVKILGILAGFLELNRPRRIKGARQGTVVALNIPMNPWNYYQKLFYDALKARHIDLIRTPFEFSVRDVTALDIDVLHCHWLPPVQQTGWLCWADLLDFFRILCICKLRRIKVCWTAHNLFPHELKRPFFVYWKAFLLIHMADLIIVHFEAAREMISRKFFVSTKKMALMHHGTYGDSYPNVTQANQAREELGLPEGKTVFLFFGLIRRYKNIHGLIRAFKDLDSEDSCLVIAGKVMLQDEDYRDELISLIGQDDRIKTFFKFIPDDEVGLYFSAADCVVLPYSDVFTSGSAMLAMTFKKPLIIKDCPFAREYFDQNNAIFVDIKDPENIRQALRQFMDGQGRYFVDETFLKKYDWKNTVEELLSNDTAKAVFEAKKD